jgi:hypothetical protein
MIRTRWFQFGRLIFAKSAEIRGVAFVLASALLASSIFAGDQVGGSTVFRNDDGSEWAVTIRPAVKTARATTSTVLVPPPPEDAIQTAAAVETDSATKLRAPSLPSTVIAAAAQVDQPAVSPPVPFETTSAAQPANEFGITVTPGGPRKLTILGRSYDAAYRSIPYRRAEYLANPGYRHDAAMELLFGQMRPTTVVRQMPEGAIDTQHELPQVPRIITPSEYWAYPRFGWPYFTGAYGAPYFNSSYAPYGSYYGSSYSAAPAFGSPTGCYWP